MEENEKEDPGIKVLKDLNFKNDNLKIDIKFDLKDNLLETVEKDSALLRKHKLIDYSLLIFFIDRKKAIKNKDAVGGSFYYDPERRTFTNKSLA